MSTNDNTGASKHSRRGFLRATATGTAVAGLGASATGTAAAQSDEEFGGWLSEDDTYDGTVVDETGNSEVTIAVGAEGNDGSNAFDPSAVKVDPGTTIIWEWTGNGFHNVVGENRDFSSGSGTDEADTTFEQTFEEEGTVKYYCNPHKSLGMRGVVIVGERSETGGAGGGEGHGEEGGIVFTPELQAMGTAIVLGVLSPIVFALALLFKRDKLGDTSQTGRGDSDLKRID